MQFLIGKGEERDSRDVKKPKGIRLVDWDNLEIGLHLREGEVNEASVVSGFDNLTRKISREVGEIIETFVFLPPQAAFIWGGTLDRLGFNLVFCSKMKSKDKKEKEEIDTVDAKLIRLGQKLIDNIRDLSFLCLVSGDSDFSLFIREAMGRGLKIIVVAASVDSLAGELIELADKTYLFEPAKNKLPAGISEE